MKKYTLLAICFFAAIGASMSHAATPSVGFANGSDTGAAALVNNVASDPTFTVSDLSNVGFGATITRDDFGTVGGVTPAGPTANSSAESHWLFMRLSDIANSPSLTDDYFGFTVSATGSNTLDLGVLKYDLVSVANTTMPSSFITTGEAFLSVDGGSFSSVGSISAASLEPEAGFGTVVSASLDLSAYTGVTTAEIRIVMSDNLADTVTSGQQGGGRFICARYSAKRDTRA
ncbi:hypothetical protein ACWPKO_10830 [Coraliomargarita sp. W4R53]